MNFYRPQRRKRERFGTRDNDGPIRCPGHLQHVRGNLCCIAGRTGHVCSPGRSHAHHVQSWRAIEGGMGMKVGDDKVAPLCGAAHEEVHRIGQRAFEKRYDINLEDVADKEWRDDAQHRLSYERKLK